MWRQADVCYGFVERICSTSDQLIASGWVLPMHGDVVSIEAVLDGAVVASQPPGFRADVAKVMWRIPNAYWCGFRFTLDLPPDRDRGRLEIRARKRLGGAASIRTAYRRDLESAFPAPPPHLLNRVIGCTDLPFFWTEGLRMFTEFKNAILEFHGQAPVRRLLDWGCGCGRLSMHFLAETIAEEHHGCDIDAEATDWCAKNLPGGTFSAIPPKPPTAYPDDFFDAIVGYSVFTHLTREMQHEWLLELRRILAPGGVAIVTVNGDCHGLKAFGQPPIRARLKALLTGRLETVSGFVDAGSDPFLDGVAPPEYYRDVFQSRSYTETEWARYFDIIGYKEGFQDMVALRRPR